MNDIYAMLRMMVDVDEPSDIVGDALYNIEDEEDSVGSTTCSFSSPSAFDITFGCTGVA